MQAVQTIRQAILAFMRPIGPFPFHPMRFDYTETHVGCLDPDRSLVDMLEDHDPFVWVNTLTIAQALDQIRIEAGLQRHADLFG
jgi:hypothetical protein